MILTEFDQKKHDKNMYAEGYDEGEKAGFDKAYRNSIVWMIENGKTPEEIADFCGYDIDKVKEIASSSQKKNN